MVNFQHRVWQRKALRLHILAVCVCNFVETTALSLLSRVTLSLQYVFAKYPESRRSHSASATFCKSSCGHFTNRFGERSIKLDRWPSTAETPGKSNISSGLLLNYLSLFCCIIFVLLFYVFVGLNKGERFHQTRALETNTLPFTLSIFMFSFSENQHMKFAFFESRLKKTDPETIPRL